MPSSPAHRARVNRLCDEFVIPTIHPFRFEPVAYPNRVYSEENRLYRTTYDFFPNERRPKHALVSVYIRFSFSIILLIFGIIMHRFLAME